MTATASQTQKAPKALAVKTLAEEVHRAGDIHVRFERGTTGAEGIATQKRVQATLAEPYVRERAVAFDFFVEDEAWHLSGRIDGCDPSAGLVEEYKTTRADIDAMHAHIGHVHRAQLHLYGAMLALEHPEKDSWQLDLCYCHPDEDQVSRRFGERCSSKELIQFLQTTIEVWQKRQSDLYRYRRERNQRLQTLPFPFEKFRPNQRALAGKVYTALKERTNLLLEAPTGSGKSLATLYPAYKALGDTDLERIFFLTSRTTGQDAAQQAAALLQASSARAVTIIAKEKACLVPGMPCDPEGCEFARGYYDRLPAALEEGLASAHNTPADIEKLALNHTVCPFELSLDLSRWCDLVVMDYNYLFDPIVRLQRFAAMPDATVLIDEAHQLDTRVRDMLSVSIAYREIRAVTAQGSDAPEAIKKSAATLGRSFKRAGSALLSEASAQQWDDVRIRPPKAFTERVSEFVAAVTELGDDGFASEPVTALLFSALRWQRAQEWLDLNTNASALFDKSSNTLKLMCLDPATHIATTLEAYGCNAQFSGTLSPLPLYRTLHGDLDAEVARVAPSEGTNQLGLYVIPDVPTWFRSRESSLPKLAAVVSTVINARAGNYFVAFPSFAYLDQFANYFSVHYPQLAMRVQERGSDLSQRAAFVEHFRTALEPTLGVVVLGGVFTESLDFADDALLGMIVVSVALPPPTNAREAMVEYYNTRSIDDKEVDQDNEMGQIVAYRQPAMVRVIQAAGRVVRNETDRGVVCLVDARFQHAEFQALQPSHWHPETVRADALNGALQTFWQSN